MVMKNFFLLLFLLPILAQSQQVDVKQQALYLKRFLEKNHVQPRKWDDVASLLFYNKWIETIDANKLLLSQEDLKTIAPYKTTIDDELNTGNFQFFGKCATLIQARINQLDSVAQSILAKPIDFNKKEQISWPLQTNILLTKDLSSLWALYIKKQVLQHILNQNEGLQINAAYNLSKDFSQAEKKAGLAVRNNINRIKLFFSTRLEEAYLNTLAWCYDPHTVYMNPQAREEFMSLVNAKAFTAGFSLAEDEEGNKTINYLQPGSSAWNSSQLHKGDKLLKIKVGQDEVDVSAYSSKQIEQFFEKNSHAQVEVTTKTPQGTVQKIKLEQEKIDDDDEIVKSYLIPFNGKNIGYIKLPGFYTREDGDIKNEATLKGCANDVSKEIVKLRKDNTAGLILDLRSNGGGSMWEALQLSGIFIDIGPIASVKDKAGKVQFLKDPNRGTIYDGPLLVLINHASASASEFTAAVLQDYNRALIVGCATYGKGTTQVILPLDTSSSISNNPYGNSVKVTSGTFFRINGSTVQWNGVEPDIALPQLTNSFFERESMQPSALRPDKSREGIYQPGSPLPVAILKQKSENRLLDNGYKAKIKQQQDFLNQRETSAKVPLNWSEYFSYFNGVKAQEKQLFDKKNSVVIQKIENNTFDKNKMRTPSQIESNQVALEYLGKDEELDEAIHIIYDWLTL